MGIYVDCAGVVLVSILLCSLCFCCMKLKDDKLRFRHRRWTGADWTWGKWTMLRVNEHCTEPHTHTKTILFSFMFYMRSPMIAQQPLICVNECVPNHSRANLVQAKKKIAHEQFKFKCKYLRSVEIVYAQHSSNEKARCNSQNPSRCRCQLSIQIKWTRSRYSWLLSSFTVFDTWFNE